MTVANHIETTPAEEGLSVILPTYNEAGNIVLLVNKIKSAVPPGGDFEILVMDDNSPDGTFEVVCREFQGDPTVRAVLRTSDRGFAKSIFDGIQRARFERIVVMDSDLTHDPADIPKLIHVGQIYDLVSASRFCAGGRMVDTSHYLVSLAYNWAIRLVLRTQIQDNLGGFFTARKSVLLGMPKDLIFTGYGEYFFRLLHFSQRSGLSIVEIPSWYLARGTGKSKSNWLRMIRTYTTAAVKMRIYMWRTTR